MFDRFPARITKVTGRRYRPLNGVYKRAIFLFGAFGDPSPPSLRSRWYSWQQSQGVQLSVKLIAAAGAGAYLIDINTGGGKLM